MDQILPSGNLASRSLSTETSCGRGPTSGRSSAGETSTSWPLTSSPSSSTGRRPWKGKRAATVMPELGSAGDRFGDYFWVNCASLSFTRVQGVTSCCLKPPVDIKAKVPFCPAQVRAGQAKAELVF